MSYKTNANLADVMLSERTRIVTQATELNRTHGVDMGILTCLQWGTPNGIFDIRQREILDDISPLEAHSRIRFRLKYFVTGGRKEVRWKEEEIRCLVLENSSTVTSFP